MFVSGSLVLYASIAQSSLFSAAKRAWRRLRYDSPELVASGAFDEDGNAAMKYTIPKDNQDVDEWVDQTLLFQHGPQRMRFETLREEIMQMKAGLDSHKAFLFLHGDSESGDSDVTKNIDFILNVDHQVTDGIGIRIVLGRYLSLLATELGQRDLPREVQTWERSFENLSPSWITIMHEEQVLTGTEYERNAELNKDIILHKLASGFSICLICYISFPLPS